MKEADVEENWERRAIPRNWAILKIVEEIIQETDASHSQIAIRWLMEQKTVDSPILGVRTTEQLQDNMGALDVNFTNDQLIKLDNVSKPEAKYPYSMLQRYNLV